ncbi:MAG: hypothetical protein WBS19_22675 [Candidatus Korobacteraceae bacterium]
MEILQRFLSLLVVIVVAFSCAAAQTGTAPIVGATVTPPETMSSADLTTQLSGVKDNSLVVANKIISGPLRIDADQRAIIPVAFKVEFRDCEFTDEVFVRKVEFAQSVILLRVKFDKGLDFESVHVQGDLRLENVEATQKIQIYQSQVDGDFHISSSVAPAFDVESLTAANVILSLGKKSVPTVDFAHLAAGRFSLSATQGSGVKVTHLVLNNASLKDTLVLQNLDLQQVEAANLTVAKRVMFLPVTMIKQLDLTSANLGGFEWDFAGPVELPQKLDIDSATLGSLSLVRGVPASAAKSPTEARRVRADRTDYGLAFLERAEYYEPAYTSYESSLKSRGQSDKADGVYFAMRDRRRYTEFLDASTAWDKIVAGFNYVIGFGHKWFFGYGRAWVYPLIWCVILVLLGGFIFRDSERMQRLDNETPARVFSPVWYSLDIFVPILSLGVAKNWRPKEEYRLLYFYSKFLSLIGLIFISAMVGALTGTLK